MNICIVISNLSGGGAEKATLNLAKAFLRNGHSVQVVLINRKIQHTVPDGVNIHILNQYSNIIGQARGFFGKYILAFLLRRLWYRLNKLNKIELTIARLPFAQEITSLSRLSAVYFVDNALNTTFNLLRQTGFNKAIRRKNRFEKIFSNKILIACSQGVLLDLSQSFGDIAKSIHLIHNPMDFDEILRLSDSSTLEVPKYRFALHVGRFNSQKRHDILLKAWAIVSKRIDMKLVLLTDKKNELNKLVDSLQLNNNVEIKDFTNNPYCWMKKSEILILSSDHEGLPMVLVEAICCGTRVVSTNCNYGPSELLKNHQEYLVPTGDFNALADSILASLSMPKPIWNCDLSIFDPKSIVAKYQSLIET